MLGQCLAPGLALGWLLGGFGGRHGALQGQQLRLQTGLVLGQRFVEHLPLLGVHRFGLGAEAPGPQARQLEGDLLELGVFELDGLRLVCDALVALVELLALRADEAALLHQAGQHLLSHLRHDLRRQTAKVLGLEGAHIEHALSVPRPPR